MKYYDYEQARREIVKASVQRNTIEIPALLSVVDFEGMNCLEISRYG